MQVFDQRGSAPHLEPWSRQDKSGICSNASSWHFGILRLVPFFYWWFLLMQVFDRHSQVLLDLGDLSHLGVVRRSTVEFCIEKTVKRQIRLLRVGRGDYLETMQLETTE